MCFQGKDSPSLKWFLISPHIMQVKWVKYSKLYTCTFYTIHVLVLVDQDWIMHVDYYCVIKDIAIGGGGLTSGICIAAKKLCHHVKGITYWSLFMLCCKSKNGLSVFAYCPIVAFICIASSIQTWAQATPTCALVNWISAGRTLALSLLHTWHNPQPLGPIHDPLLMVAEWL